MHTKILRCLLVALSLFVGVPVHAQPTRLGDTLALRSDVLGEARTLYVRLPAAYAASVRRFPVLYVLDGEWHFPVAAAAVQYLSECSASDLVIPEMIVVGIVNVDRDRDYTPSHVAEYKGMEFPTSGRAERFRRFLIDEVIPLIDASYRTTSHRVLAGWSFGGLFTVNTLAETPKAFAGYLAISPSMWWEDERFVDVFPATGPAQPTRLVVTLGTDETGGWTHTAASKLVAKLGEHAAPNLDHAFIEIEGAGHNLSVPEAFVRGLRALYRDWSVPDAVVADGLDAVGDYYESLSVRYHGRVDIPKDALIAVGMQYRQHERLAAAQEVFEQASAAYPEDPLIHYYLGRVLSQRGQPDFALAQYQLALQAELRRDPPDGLNVSLFRRRLAEARHSKQQEAVSTP